MLEIDAGVLPKFPPFLTLLALNPANSAISGRRSFSFGSLLYLVCDFSFFSELLFPLVLFFQKSYALFQIGRIRVLGFYLADF